jgi:hypothetical protein
VQEVRVSPGEPFDMPAQFQLAFRVLKAFFTPLCPVWTTKDGGSVRAQQRFLTDVTQDLLDRPNFGTKVEMKGFSFCTTPSSSKKEQGLSGELRFDDPMLDMLLKDKEVLDKLSEHCALSERAAIGDIFGGCCE